MKGYKTKIDNIKMNNTKRYILTVIFMALSVVWMAVIYVFSSQTGEESGSLSNNIARLLCNVLKLEAEGSSFERLTFLIRKSAHFTEYGILGFLYMSVLILWSRAVKYRLPIVTLMCMIYAVTDEFHQSFISGRSPAVFDVVIDTAGGFTGGVVCLLIMYGYIKIRERHGNRKEENKNDSRKNGRFCGK